MPDVYNIYDNAVSIFPSSNSINEGQITSEPNLKGIITRLKISNYVVDESTGLTYSSGTLSIPDGYKVNIAGFLLSFESTSVGSVPTDCSIYIELRFNLIDELLYGKGAGDSYTHGALVTFTTPADPDTSVLIGNVVGGVLNTNGVNHFPISSDIIANGTTNTSLTKYITEGAVDEYVSRTQNSTKKKNLELEADNTSTDKKTITLDHETIKIKDDTTELMVITRDEIDSDTSKTLGSIKFDAANNVISISGKTGKAVSIDVNGTSVLVEDNKITVGNVILNISSGNVSIACPNTVTITAPQVTMTGNLNVNGDITGTRVFGAVFN